MNENENRDETQDEVDPVMPGAANESAHEPTSTPDVAPGSRRHTGPGGTPGAPGNTPASPLDTTPVLYDEDDRDGDG